MELLKQAIAVAPWQESTAEITWIRSLIRCVESLRFDGCRLLFDLSEDATEWYREVLLPRTPTWRTLGLVTTVFMPLKLFHSVGSDSLKFDKIELIWNNDQLNDLSVHRFGRLVGRKPERYFDVPGTYDRFIEYAAKNPRRLIRLWRLAVEGVTKDEPGITVDALEKAVKKMEPEI